MERRRTRSPPRRARRRLIPFHLYGLAREDVDYILSTFQGIVKEDQAHAGIGKTRRQILDLYDDYAANI